MKKLIVLLGDKEFKDQVTEYLKTLGAISGNMSILEPITEFVPPSFTAQRTKFAEGKNFGTPVQVNDSHVRHFFSKLQKGFPAVQNYVGKVLNSPQEAFDFFKNVVVPKAYGVDFLAKLLKESFDSKPAGVYVISDATEEETQLIKLQFGNDSVSVLVTNKPEVEGDQSDQKKVDYILRVKSGKDGLRKTVSNLLTEMKSKWKVNNDKRTTTKSQFQS